MELKHYHPLPAGGDQRHNTFHKHFAFCAFQVRLSPPTGPPVLQQLLSASRNTHTHTDTCDLKMKAISGITESWKRKRKASTCSTGLQPDCDLAGRAGGRSWLGPAISSRYHCSKSNLETRGLPASVSG